MAVVINTNVDALKIQNYLSSATSKMSTTMQRMSSGLKVLSAKDDAAGTVIAARMEVQLDGNKTAQNNVQNANSMLKTTEGNLTVVEDNLVRIRDLTLQAKNGTYSTEEIQAMQDEVEERIQEIDRISTSSKFSSLQLFGETDKDGKLTGLAKEGATFQVGPDADYDNVIKASEELFQSVKFTALVAGLSENAKFNLTKMSAGYDEDNKIQGSVENSFAKAVQALDEAIDSITDRQSIIGSAENRLDSALQTLETQFENLSSAKSVILDADVAAEASDFTQYSILQQVSTSLLAQANQAPAIALSLI